MKMDIKVLGILSASHLVADVNLTALPALLPFFKDSLNVSYTMASLILLSGNLTAYVIQPAFAYFSDRQPKRWLLPFTPLIACLGMAMTGLMPNYFLLLICVIGSGVGIGVFHPEGFKTAHFFTGEKKVTGMSIFAVGGNLGLALGPMWSLLLVTSFGLKGTLGMILPGMVMAGILLFSLSWLTPPVHSELTLQKGEKRPIQRKDIFSLFLLIGIVFMRSCIYLGLLTYVPFYYIDHLKGNPLYAGKLISTFLMAGVLGTLLIGPLADRWGHKKFLAGTMFWMFPLLVLFYYVGGRMAFVSLGMAGMLLISTFSVTVVMAQAYLPQHLAMASGLIGGLAIGIAGIGVTLLGTIADIWGVPIAMKSILLLPLIGFGLTLMLKYPPNR